MAKTNQIHKLVNGEIADADDVNQIIENAGTEGGLIPYSDTDQQQDDLGAEDIGNTNHPFADIYVNQAKSLKEVDTASPSVASQVTFANLRKFIYLKDTPSTFVGQGGKIPAVNTAETALEFVPRPGSVEIFTANGSWVCPTGVTYVKVTVCGGGGGGGSADNGGGAAGGGGGANVIIDHVMKVTPGNSYTITVGGGGPGGGGSDNPGTVGGNSTFVGDTSPSNYTITSSGGNFGAGAAGTGGAAQAGDQVLTGGNPAGGGIYSFAGGAGANNSGDNGGGGGSSFLGAGGAGGASGSAGTPGGIGAGGGGAGRNNLGGNGGPGIVILSYNVPTT